MSAVVNLEQSHQPLATLKGISKHYIRGSETVEVLKELDLTIYEGDFLALMGPSGSGKTTLMNILGGLDQPTSGEMVIDGQHMQELSDGALSVWRARHKYASTAHQYEWKRRLP